MGREFARVTINHARAMNGSHPPEFDEVARGDLDEDSDSDAALLYTIEGMHGGNDYARFLAIFEKENFG